MGNTGGHKHHNDGDNMGPVDYDYNTGGHRYDYDHGENEFSWDGSRNTATDKPSGPDDWRRGEGGTSVVDNDGTGGGGIRNTAQQGDYDTDKIQGDTGVNHGNAAEEERTSDRSHSWWDSHPEVNNGDNEGGTGTGWDHSAGHGDKLKDIHDKSDWISDGDLVDRKKDILSDDGTGTSGQDGYDNMASQPSDGGGPGSDPYIGTGDNAGGALGPGSHPFNTGGNNDPDTMEGLEDPLDLSGFHPAGPGNSPVEGLPDGPPPYGDGSSNDLSDAAGGHGASPGGDKPAWGDEDAPDYGSEVNHGDYYNYGDYSNDYNYDLSNGGGGPVDKNSVTVTPPYPYTTTHIAGKYH